MNRYLKKVIKILKKQLDKLSQMARHFFKFIHHFGKHKKVNNMVKVLTVDDNLQSFDTD